MNTPIKPPIPVSTFVRSKTPAELFAEETATIVVDGKKFSDWETVMIQHRWTEAYPIFKFTTADEVEIPMDWRLLQFKPGDECAIYLGKHLAITGIITIRQAAYDAKRHGVELQGKGITWYAHRASILAPLGNFDNQSFKQVADTVAGQAGIKVLPVGMLDPTPFPRLQCEPGETCWDFLERIARPRKIVMGSDHQGNFLAIGQHTKPVTADLAEGVNIKKAQVTIAKENIYSGYWVIGSTAASNEQSGTAASEQRAMVAGSAKRYSPILTTAEQPVWNQAEIQRRAEAEATWHEGTFLEAFITVQGWMRPSDNSIWEAGTNVRIWSPMAMLDMVLKIQSVTFMQSREAGTETVLDLVAPWLLGETGHFDISTPGSPVDPNFAPATGAPLPALPKLPFATPPLILE
jgi:prophage tail gpP-like protein